MTTKETIEEYLARGGKVQQIKSYTSLLYKNVCFPERQRPERKAKHPFEAPDVEVIEPSELIEIIESLE
jgi:hypothetical protein